MRRIVRVDGAWKHPATQLTRTPDILSYRGKRAKGFEPSTYSLEGYHSTTELRPRTLIVRTALSGGERDSIRLTGIRPSGAPGPPVRRLHAQGP